MLKGKRPNKTMDGKRKKQKGFQPLFGSPDSSSVISAREWRIRFTAGNSGGFLGLAQCIMRETAWSGANECNAGNVTITYNVGGSSIATANLFDGDPTTDWFTNSSTPYPVTFTFDFGSAKAITQLVLQGRVSGDTNQDPKDFVVEYKDSLGAWQTWLSVANESVWYANEGKAYDVNGYINSYAGTQYVAGRVKCQDQNGGGFFGFSEARFKDSGGTNRAIGATFRSFRENGGAGAWTSSANINDNNTTTDAFISAGNDRGFILNWGTLYAITSCELRCRTSQPTQTPATVDIYLSPDGVVWFHKSSSTGLSWTGGETKTFAL